MHEAPRHGHHFFRLAGRNGLENAGGAVVHNGRERHAQRIALGDFKQILRAPVHADDALLLVDDHYRILHGLKNGFVRERRELDDALADQEPGIDGQHRHDGKRHEGQGVRPDTHVVSQRCTKRNHTGTGQQEETATVRGCHGRTVQEQGENRDRNHAVAVRGVRKQKPGPPLGRPGQEHPVRIGERRIPHEFVVGVGCRQCDRTHGHEQKQCQRARWRDFATVGAKTDESDDRQQGCRQKVCVATDREHDKRTRHLLDGAPEHPDAHEAKHQPDRQAAHLAA